MPTDPFDVEISGEYEGVDFEKAAQDALDTVAIETQEAWRDLMDEAGYRNTGEAIRSIAVEQPEQFVRIVGSDRIQVLVGEFGREPGSMPPPEPIADWVNEQAGMPDRGEEGFDDAVWGVQKHIEQNGLPAYHFGQNAVRESRDLEGEVARRAEQQIDEQSLDG